MHVKIGKYINWVGPYQIVDKIFFWVDRYPELKGREECAAYEQRWDYRAHQWLGDFLAGKDGHDTWLSKVCSWIYNKRQRTIKVHIDRWDTWSMDHTLAYIVLPMLKQLNATKHGAPFVDDEDVPEELKSTSAPPKENEWDTDANHFKRWDRVLAEMIWAFEQLVLDEEVNFWIVEPQGMYFEDVEVENRGKLSEMKWKTPGEYDHTAAEAYNNRLNNGLKLFGKYYRALWD